MCYRLPAKEKNIGPQHFQDITVGSVEVSDFDRPCSSVPARDVGLLRKHLTQWQWEQVGLAARQELARPWSKPIRHYTLSPGRRPCKLESIRAETCTCARVGGGGGDVMEVRAPPRAGSRPSGPWPRPGRRPSCPAGMNERSDMLG